MAKNGEKRLFAEEECLSGREIQLNGLALPRERERGGREREREREREI